MKQYQAFKLIRDINPVLLTGMRGVILEVLDPDTCIVEFVLPDGTNVEWEGEGAFQLKKSDFWLVL